MRKQLKQYGNAKVMTFSSEEMKAYDMRVGEFYDVELSRTKLPVVSDDEEFQSKIKEATEDENKNSK